MGRTASLDSRPPLSQEAAGQQLTPAQQTREMLESFAVAFILMLLMRTCLGENYQIPTGSMAPTLQGRHMDVLCEQCGYQYRTGASVENVEQGRQRGEVLGTTCPVCRFPMELDKRGEPNHRSFSGDRIIVSKLAYWLAEPERWDVIVFKCPADAKINYIKRLVGLPGETLLIRHGDIFILDPATAHEPRERQRFQIARKPPDKVLGMLQVVDDTRYIGKELARINWPLRWGTLSEQQEGPWRLHEGSKVHDAAVEYAVKAGDQDTWLRYRHLIPRPTDWDDILDGRQPDLTGYKGMLITDYYAYNDAMGVADYRTSEATNWVGDLALEAQVDVLSDQGELLLDLVEGGTHFQCRIDVETGKATLSSGDEQVEFRDQHGAATKPPSAVTTLRGAGRYILRFANVDDQLFLWVNGASVPFDGPTTFDSRSDIMPRYTPDDPGDFMPLGIGARNAALHVSYLKVLRDVYYVAVSVAEGEFWHADYPSNFDKDLIYDILSDPESWAATDMFQGRREATFVMEPDQFFPLGDNSPQSKDARLWSYVMHGRLDPPAAVDRELMIGKAVFVYWPHAWYVPTLPIWPVVPNFQRIGFIR